MTRFLRLHWPTPLLAFAIAFGACSIDSGSGGGAPGTSSGTTAGSGSMTTGAASATTTTGSTVGAGGNGGTPTGGAVTGSGGSSSVAGGGGTGGSPMTSGTGVGGATSSGTGGSGSVTSAPVNQVKGPDITFTEFPLPTKASPGGISAGPDGRIWFLHQNTGPSALGAMSTAGSNIAQYTVTVTNIGPIAITAGPDGNVWYTKQQGIGKMLPSGMYTEYGAPQGAETGGIIKGPDGNMWYTESVVDRIGTITMSGQTKDYPLPGTGRTPGDITLGSDNNLWFAETTGNKIGRITTAGVVTEFSIPTPASFPNAITAGPDSALWFVEHDGHNIGRITTAGAITEFGIPSGGRPYAIALGPDGNLWFTEPGTFNAIGRCTPTGGISEYPIPTPNTEVMGITQGPDKNMWIAERDANQVGRISNLMGGGNVASAMGGSFGTTLSTSGKCAKDTDCIASGKACGGDLCSYKTNPPSCVLAISGDPGYCTANADCWCSMKGATCNANSHACSVTSPP